MRPLVTVEGDVVRRRVNSGSKSDHQAVVLVSETRTYTLRVRGGPSFDDPALDRLVGHRVRATGIQSSGQLIMSQYDVVDE